MLLTDDTTDPRPVCPTCGTHHYPFCVTPWGPKNPGPLEELLKLITGMYNKPQQPYQHQQPPAPDYSSFIPYLAQMGPDCETMRKMHHYHVRAQDCRLNVINNPFLMKLPEPQVEYQIEECCKCGRQREIEKG